MRERGKTAQAVGFSSSFLLGRVSAVSMIAALLISSARSFAAISASASYTYQQLDATTYRYSVTLQNIGSTNIGTFWFGWIVFPPIYDLLPHQPTNVQSPAGWAGSGLNDSVYGGYSAEWVASTPLTPGQSLSGFTFDSTDSPTLMASTSPVFPLYRSDTSWVYIGASQGDPGQRFQPTQLAPEPATMSLLAPPLLLVLRRSRRDRAW